MKYSVEDNLQSYLEALAEANIIVISSSAKSKRVCILRRHLDAALDIAEDYPVEDFIIYGGCTANSLAETQPCVSGLTK